MPRDREAGGTDTKKPGVLTGLVTAQGAGGERLPLGAGRMVDNVPLGGCGRGPGVGVVGRTEDNTVLREPCVPIRAGGKAAPRLAESAPASGGIQTHM